jgi:hypothetical protein
MEELNEFKASIKGGKPIYLTAEESKASDEKCAALYEGKEIGKLEKLVCTEQVIAASTPDVYLTF